MVVVLVDLDRFSSYVDSICLQVGTISLNHSREGNQLLLDAHCLIFFFPSVSFIGISTEKFE